jgi:hypothetical protein
VTLSFIDERQVLTVIQLMHPLHECVDPAPPESIVEPLHSTTDHVAAESAAKPLQSVADSDAAADAPNETSDS